MQPLQKKKDIKNIRPLPHVSKPARADAFFGSLKSIFFRGISLPSTDIITHMRIGHSLTPNFLNNAALQRGKVDFPDHWCGRIKKENYRKQDVTISDLAPE